MLQSHLLFCVKLTASVQNTDHAYRCTVDEGERTTGASSWRFLVWSEFCLRQHPFLQRDLQQRPQTSHTLKILCALRRKKSRGLMSGEPGGQATDPPRPNHRPGYMVLKKLWTLTEKCGRVPSWINHTYLWMRSGKACNKLRSTSSKNLTGTVSVFLFSASQNGIRSYIYILLFLYLYVVCIGTVISLNL